MKILVLGLGNTILTDDGVGILVLREVKERWQGDGVDFVEASVGGLRLLELIAGYERVILIDAIQTAAGQPGAVYRFTSGELPASLHSGSTHDLSLPEALTLGRGLGVALPRDEDFVILAIEVEEVLAFGETCTPAVAAAIPRAVDMVLGELARAGS